MTGLKATSKLAFYLSRMRSRGFAPAQVLAGTGLMAQVSGNDELRPRPEEYRQIILNMIELTGDSCLGIALGQEFKISYLGVLGYAALSASTLEQSRDVYTNYRTLNEHIFTTANHLEKGRWFSEIRDTFLLGGVVRFAVEEFVSQTIELASSLTNRSFPVLELHVTYPQPADLTRYQARFACPLYFNQPRNIVVWDIERLRDPISLANEEVFRLCEQQLRLLASKREQGRLLSTRIRNYLVSNPGEFPTLEMIAGRLHMGSRTLRRRLASEDITYQQIVEDTRQQLAIQYLQYTSLTPKEIGYLLGYSSVSNFRRAFKVWTGKKLTDFRSGRAAAVSH